MIRILALAASLLVASCGGIQTEPDDTAAFAATGYTRYAWRNDPLGDGGLSKDKTYQVDPVLRETVNTRLGELGYREVAREEAEFLVAYIAGPGVTDGQLPRNASNITPVPTAMINRQMNQAEVDNAYALSGTRETGTILLLLLDSEGQLPLWKVRVTSLIENVNRVDPDRVRKAVRRGLETLPAAPGLN